MNLTVIDHPLARHYLTVLRDQDTAPEEFRSAARRLTYSLVMEATRRVPLEKSTIQSPLEPTAGYELGTVAAVAVLRAGLGMLDAVLHLIPEVKVGFSGGLIATLAARIPHKIAMELLLLGETLDARRAYEVGYVNKLVTAAALDATALDWAMRIAANAPLPSRMLKRFVDEVLPKGPSERAGIARAQVEQVNASADWAEGRQAFFDKREPNFSGS